MKTTRKPASKKQPSTLPSGQDRLERAIAYQGIASRREAKALITGRQVTVNGVVVTETGFGVVATDAIVVKGHSARDLEYILLYKPRSLETTKTTPSNRDIKDKFPKLSHLSPIGRLDKESEGLIIMTNDGTLTKALTKEDSTIDKEYLVTVRENVPDDALERMHKGILLDKIKTKPAPTSRVSRHSFTIVLHEGRKHQIRRMCSACRLTVESLVRIRIGTLISKGMKAGSMRTLTLAEVTLLKQ